MSTTLGIEYRQWEFCFELTTSFMEWIGCHQETSTLRLKESVNILQRWLLSLQQEDFTRDNQAPLFPIMDDNHFLNQKLTADIYEKKFVFSMNDASDVVEKMLNKISFWRSKCHLNQNPKAPSVKSILVEEGKTKIIIGKFETPPSVRIHFLLQNFSLEDTAAMILRYEAVGSGSYQWGDPVTVHKMYYVEFGARFEGFSSPLNSRFLGQADTRFCSIFPDTDAVFGSLGSFFSVDLLEYQGGWTVNPPFIEQVLERAAEKVISALERGAKSYFFLNYPYWDDCAGWKLLDESRFKVARYDFHAGEFLIQDAYGASLRPRMKLSIFVIGILPEGCSPVSRVYDVVHREKPAGYNSK